MQQNFGKIYDKVFENMRLKRAKNAANFEGKNVQIINTIQYEIHLKYSL
jgi:hypothetical protein